MTNALSGSLGPLAVGYLNGRIGGPHALAIVGGVSALASALLYTMASRRVMPIRKEAR